ncbi:TetR/AcrR family transcriptional regulator [Kitasatospora sp. CMC57]|uniref:TetR/AcrR family transcriptional regulator n=1 Tax=Kitasatospora sp. CMC57 TaxID=3231513 RepID=A0AB33JUA7_9ACTN
MPRAGLTPAAVVDHALELIDAHGPESLTLAAVAARAGVATPSLYKHVPGGLPELRRLIAVRVTEELAERLAASVVGLGSPQGPSRDEAMTALLNAYLDYAEQHPRRYAALPQAPDQDPERTRAADQLVGVIIAVLNGYGLTGDESVHAARTVRSTAHGFASLSAGGAFQLAANLTVTRERLIRVVVEGLRAWPGTG